MDNSITYPSPLLLKKYYGFIGLVLICVIVGLTIDFLPLAVAPIGLVLVLPVLKDYRWIYYSFWMLLPFSVELYFGSVGTDMPTEPIMLILTGLGLVLFIANLTKIDFKPIFHPISFVLLLQIVWLFFSSIYSSNQVISIKFFLAKVWYIVPFFFMSFHFLKSVVDIKKVMTILSICLSVAICIVLVRHAIDGFTFKGSHHVVRPIFRNHVNYAAIIVTVLPFTWFLFKTTENKNLKRLFIAIIVIMVVGTYFSYTRAAQGCIVIMIGAYFIIKWRLTKIVLLSASLMICMLLSYLVVNNKYLEFAPNFEKAVAHTKFDNLLDATLKMEDISTVERVYRWIAGTFMVAEKPVTGFGPGSFYSEYKKYVVRSFETYVSDNPEKSGMHNYYLMTLVEQGIPGFVLLLVFVFLCILYGEKLYHACHDPTEQLIIMACILSIIVVSTLHMMNDLLEVDKIGPIFYLSASILVIFGLKKKSELKKRSI